MIKTIVDKYMKAPLEAEHTCDTLPYGSTGYLAIESTRGGAAGGGTRMTQNVSASIVSHLAKDMGVKFAWSGPLMGGAKNGIRVTFDPQKHPEKKKEVLEAWYGEIKTQYLEKYYGTGGDVNVHQDDVIAACRANGLASPMVGPMRGMFNYDEPTVNDVSKQLITGVQMIVPDTSLKVSEMATGYGAVSLVEALYQIKYNADLTDVTLSLQGFGAVGMGAAKEWTTRRGKVIAIAELHWTVLKPDGLSLADIDQLIAWQKQPMSEDGTKPLLSMMTPTTRQTDTQFWSCGANVCMPSAGSQLVGNKELVILHDNGTTCIAPGANDPFKGSIGGIWGPNDVLADKLFDNLSCYAVNQGMAHAYAYLYKQNAVLDAQAIMQSIGKNAHRSMQEILDASKEGKRLSMAALELSLQKMGY